MKLCRMVAMAAVQSPGEGRRTVDTWVSRRWLAAVWWSNRRKERKKNKKNLALKYSDFLLKKKKKHPNIFSLKFSVPSLYNLISF